MRSRQLHSDRNLIPHYCLIGVLLVVFNTNYGNARQLQNSPDSTKKEIKVFTDSSIVTVSTISEVQSLSKHFVFIGFKTNTCKGAVFYFKDTGRTIMNFVPEKSIEKQMATIITSIKKPILTVHGNIMYSLNYRSYIDTPFAVNDLYQNSLQSYLDITFKDKYPMRVYLNTSFSNSPLFKDFMGMNFQFNSNAFSNIIKEKLRTWSQEQIVKLDTLNQIKSKLNEKYAALLALRESMADPGVLQRMIEAKEKEFIKSTLQSQSATGDSKVEPTAAKEIQESLRQKIGERGFRDWDVPVINRYVPPNKKSSLDTSMSVLELQAQYDEKGKQIDSLTKQFLQYQDEYENKRQGIVNKSDSLVTIINGVKDISALRSKLSTSGIPDSVLPPAYRKLLAVRSFGIGTLPINYSELTIKNISISGIAIEYNPKYYMAFAGGFISYRFRDYLLRQERQPKQYVTAFRFGVGRPDDNSLIMTFYSGKKYLYNFNTSTDSVIGEPKYNIIGLSVLGRFQVDKNNFITGELAKSSLPYYSTASNKDDLLKSTFALKDHSNQAWSLSTSSIIPKTQTRISANYRKTGNNFQSYSLFTTSSSQSSWYVKAEQQFMKRKLSINASLRKNDFNNPYISQAYSSSTVFKSIQATLRMKKAPVLSVGYYPSSQITKINEEQFSESLFYTLIASAAHFYKIHQGMMNTSVTFTRFYNKAVDTNFVYFNTANMSLVQGVLLKSLSLQSSVNYASNSDYSLITIGQTMLVKVSNQLRLGGGLKYNHQTILANDLLGWSVNMQLKMKKLGNIDLYFDKGFIPGLNKTLVSNEIGRVTYSRIF